MNYLTGPNVVIRSAVLASCAVPGVFPPAMLEALDYSGQTVPYMHRQTLGRRVDRQRPADAAPGAAAQRQSLHRQPDQSARWCRS